MNLKNAALLAFGLALILAAAHPLRAQTGCADSPEDPTIMLGLVGSLGVLGAGIWRSRRRS